MWLYRWLNCKQEIVSYFIWRTFRTLSCRCNIPIFSYQFDHYCCSVIFFAVCSISENTTIIFFQMDNPPSHKNSVNSSCSPLIQLQVSTNSSLSIIVSQRFAHYLASLTRLDNAKCRDWLPVRHFTASETHILALGIKLPSAGANSNTFCYKMTWFACRNTCALLHWHTISPLKRKERPSKH